MGAQQVLRAAASVWLIACTIVGVASAAPTPSPSPAPTTGRARNERVTIIDLGPADNGAARHALAGQLTGAGLVPLSDEGLAEALAGVDVGGDAAPLAAAMTEAKRAFGELDCSATLRAAREAVGIAASRQAAGLPAPELPRALAYALLCADRTGDAAAAFTAAAQLRIVGGSPDVSAQLMAKYPEVDAIADR